MRRLQGHALLAEGHPTVKVGPTTDYYVTDRTADRAHCQCEAASPPNQSIRANQRWHRAHKAEIARQQEALA